MFRNFIFIRKSWPIIYIIENENKKIVLSNKHKKSIGLYDILVDDVSMFVKMQSRFINSLCFDRYGRVPQKKVIKKLSQRKFK